MINNFIIIFYNKMLTKFHNDLCDCDNCKTMRYNLKKLGLTVDEYIENYTIDIYTMNSIQEINEKLHDIFQRILKGYYKTLKPKEKMNKYLILDMMLTLKEDEKEYKKILYKQFYNTWFNITELNLKKYDANIEM